MYFTLSHFLAHFAGCPVQVNAAGNVLLDSFVAQKEPVTDYRCVGRVTLCNTLCLLLHICLPYVLLACLCQHDLL
jgi:hypothetical protein